MPAYRFKCRNTKCGQDFLRNYPVKEFEEQQYGHRSGWCCFLCGTPRMAVIKSNQRVKDTFQPGFQRNIGEWCDSYSQYKQRLKDKGLIEIGYDELPKDELGDPTDYWTDDILKELHDEGIKFDGELVRAMQTGTL